MKSLLLLFAISFSLSAFSQISPPESLTQQQAQELEIYKKKWWMKEWPKVRRKYKVNFNCETCNAIELDLRVEVDEKGAVTNVKLLDQNVRCLKGLKRQNMIDTIMQTIRHWKLGENFHNLTFDFDLGITVKC